MSCNNYSPPEHKFSTLQKILITIGVILFVFLAATCPSEGAELHSNYVIVEKGDSLSAISQEVFGTMKEWKKLQEMNDLEGTKIHVGQKLYFAVELSKERQLTIANVAAFNYMKAWFKRRHGQRNYKIEDDSYEWIVAPIMGQKSPQLHYNIPETRRRAEWADLVKVKVAIVMFAETPEHVLLLTALCEQESGYRNLDGTHTEKSPFQIKPTTAAYYLKDKLPTEDGFFIESWLEDIRNSTYASYTILKGLGLDRKPLRKVIERYNGGSKKKEYADSVLKRYEKARKIYLKLLLEEQRRQ
jgi:LysM repeat protein